MSEIIEILMTAYNGEKFIREQIDSILNQSDTYWHLTISDDGSTDNTPEIIDEYVQKHPDKIRRHCSGCRFGNARDHFFHLMEQCKEEYMLFCDQDDVWFPEKVGTLRKALLDATEEYGRETPILVFSDQTVVDEKLNSIADSLMLYERRYKSGFDYRKILFQNVITGCTMGINKALAILAGSCIDTTQTIMHDWWIGATAAKFGKVIYIDERLSSYRQHGDNSVGAKDATAIKRKLLNLKNIEDIRNNIDQQKKQTEIFLNTFSTSLSNEDISFCKGFSRRRSGLFFYIDNAIYIHSRLHIIIMIILG